MEKNIDKNKYDKQDRYQKKTYDRITALSRKEWKLYEAMRIIAQKKAAVLIA